MDTAPVVAPRQGDASGSEDSVAAPAKAAALENIDKVETTQQFLSWFEGIEQNMEKGQEDIYR